MVSISQTSSRPVLAEGLFFCLRTSVGLSSWFSNLRWLLPLLERLTSLFLVGRPFIRILLSNVPFIFSYSNHFLGKSSNYSRPFSWSTSSKWFVEFIARCRGSMRGFSFFKVFPGSPRCRFLVASTLDNFKAFRKQPMLPFFKVKNGVSNKLFLFVTLSSRMSYFFKGNESSYPKIADFSSQDLS